MSDFMRPSFYNGAYYEIETKQGTSYVPSDVQSISAERLTALDLAAELGDQTSYQKLAKPFADYVEGTISNIIHHERGTLARLSAPGYMDCTEWTAYDSEHEALIALCEENDFEFETLRELFSCLDDFVAGYWQGTGFANARLETAEDESNDTPLFGGSGDFDENWNVLDEISELLSDEDRDSVNSDCAGMYLDCLKILGRDFHDADEASRAGSDFALSRNGHGSGYFDGSYDGHEQELQRAAKVYGTRQMVGARDEAGNLTSIYFHS